MDSGGMLEEGRLALGPAASEGLCEDSRVCGKFYRGLSRKLPAFM
jgi:hypothetical protein